MSSQPGVEVVAEPGDAVLVTVEEAGGVAVTVDEVSTVVGVEEARIFLAVRPMVTCSRGTRTLVGGCRPLHRSGLQVLKGLRGGSDRI